MTRSGPFLPLLLGLAACSSGVEPDTDLDPIALDTGTGVGLSEVGVACRATDHPLVMKCNVRLQSEGSFVLDMTAPGATPRRFTSEFDAVRHDVFAWGLQPDTDYTWTTDDGSTGPFTTGPLPEALQALEVDVGGTLFGADAVLVYVACGYFVALEGDGDVVWFARTDLYDNASDGMMWSQQDRSMLAISGSAMFGGTSAFEEVHISGAVVHALGPDDVTADLTHDVGRWSRYTYLLGEESGMGGFEVFDGVDRLGAWRLDDAFAEVPGIRGAHVNGLTVSDTGEVLVSLHAKDAVVAVDGDPASPTFLTRLWHANGNPDTRDALPDPDYTSGATTLFEAQHNVSRHGDELWVFDNRSQSSARAIRLQMDAEAGTLALLDAWSMNQQCRNQGGSTPIEGGVLATCANSGDVFAFRARQDRPEWRLNASCGGGGLTLPGAGWMTRAYPVQIR